MPPRRLFHRPIQFIKSFTELNFRDYRRIFTNAIKLSAFVHFLSEYAGEYRLTNGPSMLPTTAAKGDYVWIDKSYRRGKGIQVGDIVSFKHPMFPGDGAVKRVLGMPGDFVLRDTPGKSDQMIQVPEGHFWAIGDNIEASRDSRFYGPLPLALIKGKVNARVFPLKNMGWLENTLNQPDEEV